MTMDNKQSEMFPEIARRRSLSYSIPQAYAAAEKALPTIGEKAKFFATFGNYAKTLDVEHDRATVLGNLKVVREKVGDLIGAIDQAEQELLKAKDQEELMAVTEEALGIPLSERWNGRRGANSYNGSAEDETDESFEDESDDSLIVEFDEPTPADI